MLTNSLTFNGTTRRKHPIFLLAGLLGVVVFVWGLGYKLSLYHSGIVRRNTPIASLLSQKERPSSGIRSENYFGVGPRVRITPYKWKARADVVVCADVYIETAGRTLELPESKRAIAQQYWLLLSSSPRAPPDVA